MNEYVSSKLIKELRENKGLTQKDLALILNVSDKTISKWETANGLPDVTLIDPLAKALGVSTIELFNGFVTKNNNKSSNILKTSFYVCPICNNIITSVGSSVVSCCGINLPKLNSEEVDLFHLINIQCVEDDIYITMNHEMSKSHYISFIAYATSDKMNFVKLYPESSIEVRFKIVGSGFIYLYCNKHGLMRQHFSTTTLKKLRNEI